MADFSAAGDQAAPRLSGRESLRPLREHRGFIAVFVLSAGPLAWVDFRERSAQLSEVIGLWLGFLGLAGVTGFLWSYWPNNQTDFQAIIFAILMFLAWRFAIDAFIITLRLATQIRANRPSAPPTTQRPHGNTNKPETI